jgi:hypothetical protein
VVEETLCPLDRLFCCSLLFSFVKLANLQQPSSFPFNLALCTIGVVLLREKLVVDLIVYAKGGLQVRVSPGNRFQTLGRGRSTTYWPNETLVNDVAGCLLLSSCPPYPSTYP